MDWSRISLFRVVGVRRTPTLSPQQAARTNRTKNFPHKSLYTKAKMREARQIANWFVRKNAIRGYAKLNKLISRLNEKTNTTPIQEERVVRNTLKIGSGLAGIYLGSKGIVDPTFLPTYNSVNSVLATTLLLGSNFNLIVPLDSIIESLTLKREINTAKEFEMYAVNDFLSNTLTFGSARRSIAAAEVIAQAKWECELSALNIATESMYATANMPKSFRIRMAREISELAESLDFGHDHHKVLTNMAAMANSQISI